MLLRLLLHVVVAVARDSAARFTLLRKVMEELKDVGGQGVSSWHHGAFVKLVLLLLPFDSEMVLLTLLQVTDAFPAWRLPPDARESFSELAGKRQLQPTPAMTASAASAAGQTGNQHLGILAASVSVQQSAAVATQLELGFKSYAR